MVDDAALKIRRSVTAFICNLVGWLFAFLSVFGGLFILAATSPDVPLHRLAALWLAWAVLPWLAFSLSSHIIWYFAWGDAYYVLVIRADCIYHQGGLDKVSGISWNMGLAPGFMLGWHFCRKRIAADTNWKW